MTIRRQTPSSSLFKDQMKRKQDRYFGGNNNQTPYLSGYIFAKFILPTSLQVNYITSENKLVSDLVSNILNDVSPQQGSMMNSMNTKIYEQFLESSLMSIDVPSENLNKTTFNGLGGKTWHFPTNLTFGDSFNVSHTEFSGTPISKIYSQWIHMIRNPLYNIAPSQKGISKKDFQGQLLVWTTDPSMNNIEKQYLYTGIFPTTNPMDKFGTNIQNVDKLDIDVSFSVDMVYDSEMYPDVMEKAKSYNTMIHPNPLKDSLEDPRVILDNMIVAGVKDILNKV